jgi:hypothetical protein
LTTPVLTLDGLALPLDLLWIDEFEFTPTQQSQARTLSGALVFETAAKVGGRPITLAGGNDYGWATKTQMDALYAKLTITTPLSLVLPNAQTFSVRFRHEDTPIDAKPIAAYRVMDAGDYYAMTLKLITV